MVQLVGRWLVKNVGAGIVIGVVLLPVLLSAGKWALIALLAIGLFALGSARLVPHDMAAGTAVFRTQDLPSDA